MADDQRARLRDQDYEVVPVDQLHVWDDNPNSADLGVIHTSIDTSGFYGAIIARRTDGRIIAGNHRYLAAVQAGLAEVPVIWLSADDTEAIRIALVDNRSTRLGTDNSLALSKLLMELATSDGGLVGTGYDGDDLDALLKDVADPAFTADDSDPVGEGEGLVECPACGHTFTPGSPVGQV